MTEDKNKNINKILSVFTESRDVLFIEGDFSLSHTASTLELLLLENKRKYNCLYDVRSLDFDYIISQVDWFDIICFQTQWVHDRNNDIAKSLFAYKYVQPKIIVECVIGTDPTWYKTPKNLKNDHIFFYFKDGGGIGNA